MVPDSDGSLSLIMSYVSVIIKAVDRLLSWAVRFTHFPIKIFLFERRFMLYSAADLSKLYSLLFNICQSSFNLNKRVIPNFNFHTVYLFRAIIARAFLSHR